MLSTIDDSELIQSCRSWPGGAMEGNFKQLQQFTRADLQRLARSFPPPLCRFFFNGGCVHGSACPFSHQSAAAATPYSAAAGAPAAGARPDVPKAGVPNLAMPAAEARGGWGQGVPSVGLGAGEAFQPHATTPLCVPAAGGGAVQPGQLLPFPAAAGAALTPHMTVSASDLDTDHRAKRQRR